MQIEGDHRFKGPREIVWQLLLDPATLRAAIPGCESFAEAGPDSYSLAVRVGIEAVKGTYRGTATVRDRRPHDSYELVVQGTGIPGGLGGEARIALRDDGDGTLVSYRGEITAQGTLARLGARLLAGTAKLMIGQFFKAMEKQVAQRVA